MPAGPNPIENQAVSPFVEISRNDWAELAKTNDNPLTELEIENIRGLGDFLDLAEVAEIYLPLSQLLNLYVTTTQQLHRVSGDFLDRTAKRTPFIIGVAGSVAVGKSTVSRLLKELLSRWPTTPSVALVTTDGFLYPNSVLEEKGLMTKKGFPESYDRLALLKFVADIKSGKEIVKAPLYSHLTYDIVRGGEVVVNSPDVVIVEGLNVLQPPGLGQEVALSDYFDFQIYVDAPTDEIESWYLDRFKQLRESAFRNPESYFHKYAEMPIDEALDRAKEIWRTINLPNLLENIISTKSRATLVLQKGIKHRVERVLLRKI
ncbi:MAG: type I pantothenate kinase [Rhodoluna sp.]|nr:type I pantothenate kinase [Rhodoluna sp.]